MTLFHLPLGTKLNNQVKTFATGVEEIRSLQEYTSRRMTLTWQKPTKAKQVKKSSSLYILVIVLIVTATLCEN